MRIGILGDIHSNVEALLAVVASMREDGVDRYVQVGDIVGYGPDPARCIDIVRELGCLTCLGNHDAAALGILDTSYFNGFARAAIHWTRPRLRPGDIAFLRSLEYVVRQPEFTVVHGSLHLPDQFGYVISPVEALDSFRHQETELCFLGHSHVPTIYLRRTREPDDIHVVPQSEVEIEYEGFDRVLFNVGSVGQPRDEDPRAAYGLVDTEAKTASIRRVPYDIAAVQQKIRAAGLPEVLAHRLALGL